MSGNEASKRDDVHLGEPGFLHKLVRRKNLEGVFLFVTSRCNSRCRTCFYHDKLNSGDDLTFEQIRKISETAPRFDKLWLSGGEPTLRVDLVEIVRLFYENNGVKVLNFPTNGLLEDKVDEQVGRILNECPEMTVYLNFSLDGFGPTHDAIRGVPGNFRKTIASMERIKTKHGQNKRLMQNAATVVTPDNYDELFDLGVYLLNKDFIKTHFIEVVRGDPKDPETKGITREQLESLHERVFPLLKIQSDRLFADFNPLAGAFAKLYFLGVLKFMTEIQESNLEGPSCWGMSCTAGKTTFVIDHNGAFRSCEMRPPIGMLAEYDFDLTEALYSDAMTREIEEIGGGYRANCWCTHGCWVLSSMKFSPKTLLLTIPAAYRRLKKFCNPSFALPNFDTAKAEKY